MRERRYSLMWIATLLLGAISLHGCPGPSPPPPGPPPVVSGLSLPPDAQNACDVCTDHSSSCVPASEFASWFESGTITANGAVTPANSITFPGIPNCTFYQWSERMFMWLNSPAPPTYGGGDRIFNSPAFFDVSPLDDQNHREFLGHRSGLARIFSVRSAQVGPHSLQIIFGNSGKMFEVVHTPLGPGGNSLVRDASGKMVEIQRSIVEGGRAVFLDKAGKPIRFTIEQNLQPIRQTQRTRDHAPRKTTAAGRSAVAFNRDLTLARHVDREALAVKFVVADKAVFLDALGKVISVEQGQAEDNGVLLSQNNSLVYYTTMVNDVYAYFATGTKNGEIMPKPAHFPTSQGDLDLVTDFAKKHGKASFPDPEALAIEVKASWVEASTLPSTSNYVTMTATVPAYDQTDPTHKKWTRAGEKTVKLALVGMHVVGSTTSHPEMIWATFEHVNNTPDPDYTYTNSIGNAVTAKQGTAGTWSFCADGAGEPLNVERMHLQDPDIVADAGQTIGPSNTIRRQPWGKPPGDSASNTEIISINNNVRGLMTAGDVRSNYVMTGATWTIFGAPPGPGNQVGTNKLSNTTMETYQQEGGGTNCFTCHSGDMLGDQFGEGLSHVFGPLNPLTLP